MDSFAALKTAGDSGAEPIVAGKAKGSELFRLLVTKDSDERMPQKADALPIEEAGLIGRWIEEGAIFDGSDPSRPLAELVRESYLRPAPDHYPRPAPVTALAFNGDGRRLAVSGYREVLLWDIARGSLARRIGGMPERISSLAWTPQKNLIAVAGGSPGQWGSVILLDANQQYRARFLCDLPELVLSVDFNREGTILVAGCGDRTLRVFDTSTGKQTKVLRLHADWVQDVAFNPGGTRLVTASRDRTARVLDTADWHQISSYQDHDTALLAATFSSDGSRVFSTAKGSGQIWHPEQANRRGTLNDLDGDARKLVSGPFGVAAGCGDGTIRFYQGESKNPWMLLSEHRDSVESLATTRNGELIASGSADGEVIVWTSACWAPLTRFVATP